MGGSPGTPSNPSPPYSEKRTVPRYSFIADVDVTDLATETRMSGRVSEISRKGCFVDLLNPLPKETAVQLNVSRDQGVFTTRGRIIYTQEGMGMGVAFEDISPDQLKTLDAWLAELSG
jgi:PilZ domain-containing protein